MEGVTRVGLFALSRGLLRRPPGRFSWWAHVTTAPLRAPPAPLTQRNNRAEIQPPESAATTRTSSPGARRTASVAVLCGPCGHQPLPPCQQRLSDDGHFRYLGGSSPIEPALADRAQRLALAALACFPATCGYVGVDLVLGQADDGSGDVVVEVNPRLTTSYVGLRRLLQTNLATAVVAAAAGRAVELRWARQRVEFTAEGQIL